MTCLSNKTVRTKKPHRCFSCLRLFPTNTKMNYWTGIYENDFSAVYSCMACVEIMNMRQDPDEDGFPEGYVKEMLDHNETPEMLLEKYKMKASTK